MNLAPNDRCAVPKGEPRTPCTKPCSRRLFWHQRRNAHICVSTLGGSVGENAGVGYISTHIALQRRRRLRSHLVYDRITSFAHVLDDTTHLGADFRLRSAAAWPTLNPHLDRCKTTQSSSHDPDGHCQAVSITTCVKHGTETTQDLVRSTVSRHPGD